MNKNLISEGAKNFDDAFGLSDTVPTEPQRVFDDHDIEDAQGNSMSADDFRDMMGMVASENKKVPKEKMGNLSGNVVTVDKKPTGAFAPAHTIPKGVKPPKSLTLSHDGKNLTHNDRKNLEKFNLKKNGGVKKPTIVPAGIDFTPGIGGLKPKTPQEGGLRTNFLSNIGSLGGTDSLGESKKPTKGALGIGLGSTPSPSSRVKSGKSLEGYGGRKTPVGPSKVTHKRHGGQHTGRAGRAGGINSSMFSLFPGFESSSISGHIKKKVKKKVQALAGLSAIFLLLFMAAFSIMGDFSSAQREQDNQNLGAATAISALGSMEEDEIAALMEEGQQPQSEVRNDEPVIDDDDGDGDTRRRVESDSDTDLYAGQSDGGGPSNVEGFTNRQIENYTVAYNAAVDEGLTEKGILNVMMVITTESRGWNLANDGSDSRLKSDQDPAALRESMSHPQSDGLPSEHGYGHGGDHGSVGIMQQQFPWWGTVEQLMDRDFATRKFIEEMKKFDYDSMPSGEAIQKVQKSFDPTGSNYTREEPVARAIMEEIESR